MKIGSNLPNFFIIGAAKAGTTTLSELIKQHPDVYMSTIKEPQFFCNDELFNKGLDYYLGTFFNKSQMYQARGEATPHYLYFDKAAKRISKMLPRKNQRFIVLLRDPVERAYSLYWNMVAEGEENLVFEDALIKEEVRSRDPELGKKCSLKYQYVRSGKYAEQIQKYLEYFEKDQFLFLLFEDFICDQDAVLKQVFSFLSIPSDISVSSGKAFNASGVPRLRLLHKFVRKPHWIKEHIKGLFPKVVRYRITSKIVEMNKKNYQYNKMNRETEKKLRKEFRQDILNLEIITGRDLSDWLKIR